MVIEICWEVSTVQVSSLALQSKTSYRCGTEASILGKICRNIPTVFFPSSPDGLKHEFDDTELDKDIKPYNQL